MKTTLKRAAFAALYLAASFQVHAASRVWASCMIQLKGDSGGGDVWLLLDPIQMSDGTVGPDYADSLVARLDKEVGIAKQFPGHSVGRHSCDAKPDRASAMAYREEFIATNKRFFEAEGSEMRSLDWAPGKTYPKSGGTAHPTHGAPATAQKPASAPALTVKDTSTKPAGLTADQLARQREADAARSKAQADAKRNDANAQAEKKKRMEERRKQGNKQ